MRNMKRTFILLSIFFIYCFSFEAQTISKKMATEVAIQYIKKNISESAPKESRPLIKATDLDTTYTKIISLTGVSPLYLVQLDEGWVLVSSELAATPILASAPIGKFPSINEMPDGMKWLLSYYEQSMQYARDSLNDKNIIDEKWKLLMSNDNLISQTRDDNPIQQRSPTSYIITDLALVLWNQNDNNSSGTLDCNKVYNKFCPTWYTPFCGHTVVGCTNVAIGMAMWYYKWPYSAIIPNSIDSLTNISLEKHFVAYNWDIMPTAIYNSTDTNIVNEVAGFLRDCGYANKTKYKPQSSSASFDSAKYSLEHTFHYKTVSHKKRNQYIGNWINKLKTEISADRPVIYAGYGPNGGHAFVLFGYDSDDKFNINWGWGGESNSGTYSLDALSPSTLSNGPYNDTQEALWGIEPDYPNCGSTTYSLQQSDVNVNNFEIYRGGAISASNITINNNRSGVIFSGESVTLGSGFKIEAGSHVVIDVKDMHCDDRMAETEAYEGELDARHAPQRTESYQITSTANKILRDGHIYIFRDGKVYSIIGLCVR